MIDPAKLATFAFVTALVSLVPGPQMVFVMTQAAWRGRARAPRRSRACSSATRRGSSWPGSASARWRWPGRAPLPR